MTKNRSMRIAVLVLALALITCCFVGTTFAKYASEATGTSNTATVAKWSIDVNGDEIAVASTGSPATVDFDIFDTAWSTNGSSEDNVADGVVAPGTSGSFNFEVTNNSEVTAKYYVTFALVENAKNVPIEYSLNGTDGWTKDVATLSMTEGNAVELEFSDAPTADKTVSLYWRWAFVGDDTVDTDLGVLAQTAAPTVKISATVYAIQVD